MLLLLLALNDLTKGFLFDEDADLDMDSSISSFRLAEEFFRKNLSEDIIFELGLVVAGSISIVLVLFDIIEPTMNRILR